ncbi:MAG TPA: hypothetical protein VJA23_06190 [Candidatus Nanoarchaeia archaeon]|nr:hypothetical protein [Candidatus Nanoarchaeia archaeon]
MKQIIFLVILLAGLLLLTACEGQKQPTGKGAYIGGTQGVLANFEPFGVEEAGVYSLFDTETFPLEVTVTNKGEYELKAGDVTVKLMGPSKEEMSGISSWDLKNTGSIEPISDLLVNGGEETISFASDAKYTKPVEGILTREWFANVEYKYQTYLIIPEVCLKEDLKDTRVCTVEESKSYFVSGAPLTVTSVEESTAGKGIMALKIKIKNVAGGKATKIGEEFGIQEKLAYTIDDAAWECKQGGSINAAKLILGEAEIVCKLKEALAEKTLSTKQVKLTFDYAYRDLIQEKLNIKESAKD